MKRLSQTLILLVLIVYSITAFSWGVTPEPYDKVAHVIVGAAGTYVGYKICQKYTSWSDTTCRITSSVTTFTLIGPLKEASDINWDNGDIAASGAGVVIGIGLTLTF